MADNHSYGTLRTTEDDFFNANNNAAGLGSDLRPGESLLPDVTRGFSVTNNPSVSNINSVNNRSINTGTLDEDYNESTSLLPSSHSINVSPGDLTGIKSYRRRWYIVSIFSLMAFFQGGLMNIWSVIAKPVEVAFGWQDSDISILASWAYTTFILSLFLYAMLMEKKGLRPACVLTAFLLVSGAAVRCITASEPYVTKLAHLSNILIGLAGPVAFTAGPVISATWFPPHQRGTATAVSTIAGFTGSCFCFMFGPMIVEDPVLAPGSKTNYTNIDAIKKEILFCRYIECGMCAAIFLAVLIYFPSRPPTAPSITAAMGKLQFMTGIKDLCKKENRNFWLICFSYCLGVSIYGVWNGLYGVNLKDLVSTTDVGYLGFSSVLAGSVAAVIFGRISDLFMGHMKRILLFLNVGCILSTFWFILVFSFELPYRKAQLFTAAILQGLCNNGAIPLYYELAIESTYPITEVCISTIMTLIYNALPILFLLIFLIKDVGTHWMNWVLYGALMICFPMLLKIKEQHKRTEVDRGEAPAPASLQASVEVCHDNERA